jgi:hypothetical protein
MPALGRTVSVAAVREDQAAMDAVDFAAEYLGWVPAVTVPSWGSIKRGVWEGRADMDSAIEGEAALGLEIDEDRREGWIAAAGRRFDQDWHVEVVEPGYKISIGTPGTDWMLPRVLEICEGQKICAVVIDPRRPARSLVTPLRRVGITVLTPPQGEIAASCGVFYDATGQGRDGQAEIEAEPEDDGGGLTVGLWHMDQPTLNAAVAHARKYEIGLGAFVWVKRGIAGNVGPLYAVTLAMHGHAMNASPERGDVGEEFLESATCRGCGRSTYLMGEVWCHAMDDTPQCN